jgi:hypothetical protein
MREHFHLLITEPQIGTSSTVMQVLKWGFARRIAGGDGESPGLEKRETCCTQRLCE